ncbi:protein of unknown function [Mycolicibacterium rutilum]|uniref:DUF4352 domain-containing protein n=1 Tax=Mycolicibacterium rutilum TaxID=370526 RepID=A0A1H6IJU2_MYCRU|nr:DUF2510 domain-containing protein [Mycolicibacterium rutilum]SEH46579.1 protein of unknown function [Mycolicibacterium rutilum]
MTTPPTPAGWYPDPEGAGGQRYWDGSAWTEHRSPADTQSYEPAAAAPAFDIAPASVDRGLLTRYLAACAAMLAVLIAAVAYGVFVNDDTASEPASIQIETPAALPPGGWGVETEAPTDPTTTEAAAAGGEAVDGPLAFSVADVEVGTTVSSTEAPVEKDAVGEYVVVRLSVVNISDAPAQFLGTFQTLFAGGTEYNIDDEATFYVNGGFVEIPPGAEAQVGVAFDVPPGTAPEFIDLHADPMSPGVQIPLP